MTLFDKLFPTRSSLRRLENAMSDLITSVANLRRALSDAVARINVDVQTLKDQLAEALATNPAVAEAIASLDATAAELDSIDPLPDVPAPPDETPPEPPADVVGEVTPGPDTFPGPQE